MAVATLPRVVVVVVNWNRRDETLECLRSLAGLDYSNYDVIFVDNGSSDGSIDAVRRMCPDAAVIRHERNLGYTGGNNAGIRYALEHGADYVWLLNNDTVVDPSSLTELVKVAENDRRTAMVSATIVYHDSQDRVQFQGAVVDRKRFAVVKSDRIDRENLVVWGTALLVRTSAIREMGVLRDDLFAYWEDIEYSERAIEYGYVNRVAASSVVYHKSPPYVEGRLKRSPTFYFYMTRNAYRFWMPRIRGWERVRFLRRYLSEAVETVRTAHDSHAHEIADACWDGLWAAVRGIAGERRLDVRMPAAGKLALLGAGWLWRMTRRVPV